MAAIRSQAWNEQLWAEIRRLAKGLDGADVVACLAETSDAVWEAGLDHAFIRLQAAHPEQTMSNETAACFDNTWLSVFASNLARTKRARMG